MSQYQSSTAWAWCIVLAVLLVAVVAAGGGYIYYARDAAAREKQAVLVTQQKERKKKDIEEKKRQADEEREWKKIETAKQKEDAALKKAQQDYQEALIKQRIDERLKQPEPKVWTIQERIDYGRTAVAEGKWRTAGCLFALGLLQAADGDPAKNRLRAELCLRLSFFPRLSTWQDEFLIATIKADTSSEDARTLKDFVNRDWELEFSRYMGLAGATQEEMRQARLTIYRDHKLAVQKSEMRK